METVEYVWTHKFVENLAQKTRGYTERKKYDRCFSAAGENHEQALALYTMIRGYTQRNLRSY